MANKAIRIGVSLALMVVLLAVFLWNVDFQEVGRSLAGADLQMLLAASLVALFAYWLARPPLAVHSPARRPRTPLQCLAHDSRRLRRVVPAAGANGRFDTATPARAQREDPRLREPRLDPHRAGLRPVVGRPLLPRLHHLATRYVNPRRTGAAQPRRAFVQRLCCRRRASGRHPRPARPFPLPGALCRAADAAGRLDQVVVAATRNQLLQSFPRRVAGTAAASRSHYHHRRVAFHVVRHLLSGPFHPARLRTSTCRYVRPTSSSPWP